MDKQKNGQNNADTTLSKRDQYLNNFFEPEQFENAKGLEIGPYDRPFFPRSRFLSVQYADVFTTAELIERAKKNPNRSHKFVEDVDYVIAEKSIAQAVPNNTMEFVFCSHVLEHVPNLIKTLQEIESTMTIGGQLLVAYPDRRYTFDIARKPTSYKQLISRNKSDLQKPDSETVRDYFSNYRNVFVGRIWQGMENSTSEPVYTDEYSTLMSKLSETTYVDVHCNIFTDDEFVSIIENLVQDNFINLKIVGFENTRAPRNEFLLTLQRCQNG